MDDIHQGRRLARLYVTWGVIAMIGAGCALGVTSAFDAAYDGAVSIPTAVWGAHSWITILGWSLTFCVGLVAWLLPLLKESPVSFAPWQRLALLVLLLGLTPLVAAPLLEHAGRRTLVLPVVGYLLLLTFACGYGAMVWRVSSRSLRPSTADVGIQAGTAWLLVLVFARFAAALGALATGRADFLASCDGALLVGATYGFMVNTGLGLAVAILPEFLHIPHARPQVQATFSAYNISLALLTVGLMWCLPFPFSWGRFPLVACAFVFTAMTISLVVRLQLLQVVFAPTGNLRQLLARWALATALICLMTGSALLALLAGWITGLMAQPPSEVLHVAVHIIAVGFFTTLALALAVPLMGPTCLRGVAGAMAVASLVLVQLWTVGSLALCVLVVLRGQEMWYERAVVGTVGGVGAMLFGLWLCWRFAALEARARRTQIVGGME